MPWVLWLIQDLDKYAWFFPQEGNTHSIKHLSIEKDFAKQPKDFSGDSLYLKPGKIEWCREVQRAPRHRLKSTKQRWKLLV